MNIDYVPSCIVILFDPYGKHTTLDEDRYRIFYRFTTFNDVRNLIDARQCGQIDLHVPTDFSFESMRPYPRVYIHTYFVDNKDTSIVNDIERDKIRESIRICCAAVGEEFVNRGIIESNDQMFQDGISLADQIRQMDIDRMNALLQ
jgi:hypothetical protein